MASRHVVALLLVATLTAGACGGGGEDPEVADADRSTTTTEAVGEAAPEVDEQPTLKVDGTPAATETPSAAPLAPAPAPPAAGSAPAEGEDDSTTPFRPTPGTYRYEGESRGERVNTTVRYEEVGQEPSGFRLRQTTLDQEGFGNVQEVLWSVSGIRTDRQHNVGGGEESGKCDWRPDLVAYLFPIEVGRRWEATTTCYSTDPTRPGTLTQKSVVRVTDRRRATVAGITTTVFVLERDSTTTLGAAGVTVVRRRTSTELWSPRYGINVEEHGTSSTDTPGEDRPPGPFRFKLVDLRPR